MPFLVIKHMLKDTVECIFVIQPEHLVNAAYKILLDIFSPIAHYFTNPILCSMQTYLTIERKISSVEMNKYIVLCSDVEFKRHKLQSIMNVSPKYWYHTSEKTCIIYDEIDVMYNPTSSKLNIPTSQPRRGKSKSNFY